jgi:hypothetical protein
MNSLSSHSKNVIQLILFSLGVSLLASTCLNPAKAVYVPAAQPTVQDVFLSYGFNVEGFTEPREEIILKTLDAYAQVLGSRQQFRKIITNYNGGKNWKISFDPTFVGADSSMKLSPTVFSREKSQAANYSTYGARDDETYARIVIGHEIGHLLVQAAKAWTGINLAELYKERVKRNWQRINDSQAPDEEAVTQLSLKVNQADYYFRMSDGQPEAYPENLVCIDGWVTDFIQFLKSL